MSTRRKRTSSWVLQNRRKMRERQKQRATHRRALIAIETRLVSLREALLKANASEDAKIVKLDSQVVRHLALALGETQKARNLANCG